MLWSDFQQRADCFPIPGAKTKPFLVVGLSHYLLFTTELDLGSEYTLFIHSGGSSAALRSAAPIRVAAVLKYFLKKNKHCMIFMSLMH